MLAAVPLCCTISAYAQGFREDVDPVDLRVEGNDLVFDVLPREGLRHIWVVAMMALAVATVARREKKAASPGGSLGAIVLVSQMTVPVLVRQLAVCFLALEACSGRSMHAATVAAGDVAAVAAAIASAVAANPIASHSSTAADMGDSLPTMGDSLPRMMGASLPRTMLGESVLGSSAAIAAHVMEWSGQPRQGWAVLFAASRRLLR